MRPQTWHRCRHNKRVLSPAVSARHRIASGQRCQALTRCSAPFSCRPLRGWYFSSARSDTSSRTCATLTRCFTFHPRTLHDRVSDSMTEVHTASAAAWTPHGHWHWMSFVQAARQTGRHWKANQSRCVGNPTGRRACSACSRSARVCAAEMQTRARALISGVAGKPTTTSATPRSQHSRDAAAILPGWNSITGCAHESRVWFSVFHHGLRSLQSRADATGLAQTTSYTPVCVQRSQASAPHIRGRLTGSPQPPTVCHADRLVHG